VKIEDMKEAINAIEKAKALGQKLLEQMPAKAEASESLSIEVTIEELAMLVALIQDATEGL
jgi:hypothetical protein